MRRAGTETGGLGVAAGDSEEQAATAHRAGQGAGNGSGGGAETLTRT